MPRFPSLQAVLLDRDGTVIVEKEYLSDPAGVELLPGSAEGLHLLQQAGLKLVILTNQAGIGRGYFTQADADRVQDKMRQLLKQEGVTLDGIYMCPHAPGDNCACRKPKPGMAWQAAADLGLDLTRTAMVGDKALDVEMGQAVGATSILVQTGYGKEEAAKCSPDYIASDLADAARFLLS